MGGWMEAVKLGQMVEKSVLEVPDIEAKVKKAAPAVGVAVSGMTGNPIVGQVATVAVQTSPRAAIVVGTHVATGAAIIVGSVVLPFALAGMGLWMGAKALFGDKG